MMQARRAVDHDFATARTVYEQQLQALKLSVEFAAAGATVQQYLAGGDRASLAAYLERIRQDAGFDFLSLTDQKGRVVFRVSQPGARTGRRIFGERGQSGSFREGRRGHRDSSRQLLGNEIRPCAPGQWVRTQQSPGMALMAAAPVGVFRRHRRSPLWRHPFERELRASWTASGNSSFAATASRTWTAVRSPYSRDDVRISTNVRTTAGERAIGTRAPREVSDAVLKRGETLERPGVCGEGLVHQRIRSHPQLCRRGRSACSPSAFSRTPTRPSATR